MQILFRLKRTEAPANRLSEVRVALKPECIVVFGAMSKDLYVEISAHFGIEYVENFAANRRNRFINRYGETDNYLRQMLR